MRNPAYGGDRRKRAHDSKRARCDGFAVNGGLAIAKFRNAQIL